MTVIYKCDFYGTTDVDENKYPQTRETTITGLTINGIDCEMDLKIKLRIPTISGKINASGAAWRDAARELEAWLAATFP